jgi:hypothetical protein
VRRYRALARTGKRPPHFSQLGTPEHQEEWSFSLGPPNFSQIAITKPGCVRVLGEALPNFSQYPALLLTDNRPISHRTRPTFSHSVGIIVYDQRFTGCLKLNPKQNYFSPQRTCFNSSSFTAPFWLVNARDCASPPCCETPLMR